MKIVRRTTLNGGRIAQNRKNKILAILVCTLTLLDACFAAMNFLSVLSNYRKLDEWNRRRFIRELSELVWPVVGRRQIPPGPGASISDSNAKGPLRNHMADGLDFNLSALSEGDGDFKEINSVNRHRSDSDLSDDVSSPRTTKELGLKVQEVPRQDQDGSDSKKAEDLPEAGLVEFLNKSPLRKLWTGHDARIIKLSQGAVMNNQYW